MKIIVAFAILLAIFIIFGAVMRKKIYREVDRLGLWKIDLLNRPVSEEMAKVKSLSLVGETEKHFEKWRNEWERIVAIELPDLEESLIDAEELSDKYRFRKAKQTLASIEQELHHIEERVETILKEIEEWVKSEETSKVKAVTIQQEYNEAKQYLLSHYASFGKAAAIIEKDFEKIDEGIVQYEEAVADANYPKAETVLIAAQEILENVKEKLEKIPQIRVQLTSELPKKLKQLENDIHEMKMKGFLIEKASFQKEIDQIRKLISEELKRVESDNIAQTEETIAECHKRIEALYDLLVKEAEAKRNVLTKQSALSKELEALEQTIVDLKKEVEIVLERYRIDDKDLQSQANLEKRVEQLRSKFESVKEAIDDKSQSYTSAQQMLEEIEEKAKEVQSLSKEYANMLHNLRKDELEAKETIQLLLKQLFHAKRSIQRYNLPGVPETFFLSVEDAEEKISEVEAKLQESPLDIPAINYALKQALKAVEDCLKMTEEMIETSLLSEKLIQYGNRYRSLDPVLDQSLKEAEMAFRRYDYAEALEIAARAIEPIDPDALKQIQIELDDLEFSIPVKS